jgi:hypothetical protein
VTEHELQRLLARRARVPATGGWATDPHLTERRLIRLAPATLDRLGRLAERCSTERKRIAPMLVAALLLERAVRDFERQGGK